MNVKHFLEISKPYDVISFDIFDTLLFRACGHPSNVFRQVGTQAIKESLFTQDITSEEFTLMREKAQQSARSAALKLREDYTLSDVYNIFPLNLGHLDKLQMLEVEYEKINAIPNFELCNALLELSNEGKLIILVSDMYLIEENIWDLLRVAGINKNNIDKLYVSSVYNARKSEGELFEIVKSDYCGQSILHIGDNFISDYVKARANHIDAIHYSPENLEFDKVLAHEELFLMEQSSWLSNLRKQFCSEIDALADVSELKVIGCGVLGPYFTLFADWVIDQLIENETHVIYAFMSEGLFFKKLIKSASNIRNYPVHVELIYTSRRASFLATLDTKKWNRLFVKTYLEHRKNSSLIDALEQIKVNLDDLPCLQDFDDDKNLLLENWSSERLELLIQVLLSSNFVSLLSQRQKESENLLCSYLEQKFQGGVFVTLDLGYQGTIAKNVEKVLISNRLIDKATHLLGISMPGITTNRMDGVSYKVFIPSEVNGWQDSRSFFDYCQVIESILNAGTRSTIGYEYDEDYKVKPVFEASYESKQEERIKLDIQNGVFYFQNQFYKSVSANSDAFNIIKNEKLKSLHLINRLLHLPTLKEANALGEINFLNGFYDSKPTPFINNVESYWQPGYRISKDYKTQLKKYIAFRPLELQAAKRVQALPENVTGTVAIYGAGEAGLSIYKYCNLLEKKIHLFIDSNPDWHGSRVNGVPVVSLDNAISQGVEHIIIGSFAFENEIEFAIRKVQDIKSVALNIYR